MNIFVLSKNPQLAAHLHCDKHVVKMILETAQLLYSAHSVIPEGGYKKTHVNHPCAIWTRESVANYKWLAELGWWLCKEYQFRYGEHKTHKTEKHIVWLTENVPDIPDVGLTPFRQAMPVIYKCEDPVEAYQAYYLGDKVPRGFIKYTRRERPEFIETHT
jgi:hypothetical protein